MAFETIDEWQVERRLFVPGISALSLPELPARFPFRQQLQKAPSAIFAIALHSLFLYFLISSAFDREIERSQVSEKNTLTMIELGNSPEEAAKAEPVAGAGNTQSQPAYPVPNELETTMETELPPEWSVGRIRVERARTNSSVEEVGSENGAASDAGGNKGGGIYDPFAGAAPNRKPGEKLVRSAEGQKPPSLVERVTGFFGFGANDNKISPDAFKQLVQSLRQRLPRAKGSVELVVSIDGSGKVTSAKVMGGTASAQVKFFVRNAVIGKQLAGGRATAKNSGVKLPVIRFS